MSGIALNLALACVLAPPVETSAEATTHLYIRTTPPGARVSVGGKILGTSPGVFPVNAGVQRIVIELDGHGAEEKQLLIRAGRVTRLELELKKGLGSSRNTREALEDKPLSYGPVIEQTLKFPQKRVGRLFDLDTGDWATIDKFGEDDRETHRRIREVRVDLSGGVEHGVPAVLLFDASVFEISSDKWDTITPAEVVGNWPLKQNEPLPITTLVDPDPAKLPKTCLFETREGSLGVLQLVGADKKGTGAKIRFKLLKSGDHEAGIRE